MIVKELIEKLKLAPEDAEVERGDTNKNGDLAETPVDRIEITLGEDYKSVIIY